MDEVIIGNINHLSKFETLHYSCIYEPGASSDYGPISSSHNTKNR